MITEKFDGEGFIAALDAERTARRLTWKKVAEQSGVPASTLTRMSQGRRPDVDSLTALCRWSGLSADKFAGGSGGKILNASPLAEIATILRGDPKLSKAGVEAIETILKAAYDQFREK